MKKKICQPKDVVVRADSKVKLKVMNLEKYQVLGRKLNERNMELWK